ncbi:MAG: hypothetical protein LHW64_10190 [Candidatus Cloacimonetes bacterium]|nr:hypothetical protein [Candidatus Cloacimonadota bacterium]MDY0230478.1 hypothetical protein [Candidatus Cloacimonadaceae bacterium]
MKKNKLYMIFTGTIYEAGGGQIYTRNKVDYLKENGWAVFVFSLNRGQLMINELKDFEKNVFPLLKFEPSLFSVKNISCIIKAIMEQIQKEVSINNCSEIIIESHTIPLSLWGEVIAESLNCKHFVYLLQERYHRKLSLQIMDFLDFKHQRKELAGIKNDSLNFLFKNYKTLGPKEQYFLTACCTNSVADVNCETIEDIERAEINIGCISNLAKPYVITVIDEIVLFAKEHKKKNFFVLLVGNAGESTISSIVEKLKTARNVKFLITGYLFPLPRKIFKIMDLFIGVAGAANLSSSEGVLTMTVDVNTHKAIGFLGYDTSENLFAAPGSGQRISVLLESVFIDNKFPIKDNKISKLQLPDYMEKFKEHMDFAQGSSERQKYYGGILSPKCYMFEDVEKLKWKKTLNLFITLFGPGSYENLRTKYHALTRGDN